MGPLTERLERLIASSGPISVAQYMAEANAHYYGTRDPIGAAGDFITAPEISQMFGELIGLWCADLWLRAGRRPVHYVEMGPGRGSLAADALRAMRNAGLRPPVHFVETSATLRRVQAERVPQAQWHDDAASLPDDAPLLIVANEFFDALPVRQLALSDSGWRELMVAHREGGFVRVPGNPAPAPPFTAAAAGEIVETSPASIAIVRELARRLVAQGGAALIVDYGHRRSGFGDTLQAVSSHGYADPWVEPGTRDLTAHVDFEALAEAARAGEARLFGPVEQGAWLRALGIDARAAALSTAAPGKAGDIAAARDRLILPDQMGSLFKVLALAGPDWPEPQGFR